MTIAVIGAGMVGLACAEALVGAAPLPTKAEVMRGEGAMGWAARDSAKPGRGGPETWVI